MSVTAKGPGLSGIEKSVRDLLKKEVLVGIPAEATGRPAEPGAASPITNAQIGYWNEYGVPERNIPARPHLIPGIDKARPKITRALGDAALAALFGNDAVVDQKLNVAGLTAQSSVQSEVTDGSFAPLSQVTLKRRRAKGRTGEKPLIDTGQYRRSLTYVVRQKGQ